MERDYVFMTDSDSDLPFHLKEQYDIPVVYMPYALDGKEYFDDLGQSLNYKSYYDMMRGGAVPVTSALNEETFALLPRLFGVKPGDMIEMTVRTPQEAEEASVQAAAFCKAHGESPRNSMLLSLCVEEMVNNIVAHGFKANRTDQCVDIRILFKDGQRIIRIRDNCVNFDPVEYLKLHESDDPSAHIGIRMVMKMVKSANYVNSLGLNNLTLVL